MILPDVNVLVYAHREDAVDHARYRAWLETAIRSGDPYGLSDHVLSGFLRVVTHARVFTTPSPIRSALDFVRQVRTQPNCALLCPGPAIGKSSPTSANRSLLSAI
jgi:toxin-antitoxin system PIN domain toxin